MSHPFRDATPTSNQSGSDTEGNASTTQQQQQQNPPQSLSDMTYRNRARGGAATGGARRIGASVYSPRANAAGRGGYTGAATSAAGLLRRNNNGKSSPQPPPHGTAFGGGGGALPYNFRPFEASASSNAGTAPRRAVVPTELELTPAQPFAHFRSGAGGAPAFLSAGTTNDGNRPTEASDNVLPPRQPFDLPPPGFFGVGGAAVPNTAGSNGDVSQPRGRDSASSVPRWESSGTSSSSTAASRGPFVQQQQQPTAPSPGRDTALRGASLGGTAQRPGDNDGDDDTGPSGGSAATGGHHGNPFRGFRNEPPPPSYTAFTAANGGGASERSNNSGSAAKMSVLPLAPPRPADTMRQRQQQQQQEQPAPMLSTVLPDDVEADVRRAQRLGVDAAFVEMMRSMSPRTRTVILTDIEQNHRRAGTSRTPPNQQQQLQQQQASPHARSPPARNGSASFDVLDASLGGSSGSVAVASNSSGSYASRNNSSGQFQRQRQSPPATRRSSAGDENGDPNRNSTGGGGGGDGRMRREGMFLVDLMRHMARASASGRAVPDELHAMVAQAAQFFGFPLPGFDMAEAPWNNPEIDPSAVRNYPQMMEMLAAHDQQQQQRRPRHQQQQPQQRSNARPVNNRHDSDDDQTADDAAIAAAMMAQEVELAERRSQQQAMMMMMHHHQQQHHHHHNQYDSDSDFDNVGHGDSDDDDSGGDDFRPRRAMRYGTGGGGGGDAEHMQRLQAIQQRLLNGRSVDEMSYEQLQELCEALGSVNTGLTESRIDHVTVPYRPSSSASAAAVSDDKKSAAGTARQEQEEEERCAICLDALRSKECVSLVTCQHHYHKECISKWLQHHAKCPVCMSDIPRGTSNAASAF